MLQEVIFITLAAVISIAVYLLFKKVTPKNQNFNFSSKYRSALVVTIVTIIFVIVLAYVILNLGTWLS